MMEQNIFYIEETTSTNQLLWQKANEQSLPEGFVIQTDFQSNGRGQGANTWESEKKKNLLCSLLLFPQKIDINQQFLLSEIVALAVKNVLQKELNKTIKIKWPNDIYVDNKKIAGILIENKIMGKQFATSIIGIGLNINQTHFFSNAPNPISMKILTQKDFDIKKIMLSIREEIMNYYKTFELNTENLQKNYFDSLYRNNNFYPYKTPQGNSFMAKIQQVLPSGQLVLIDSNGKKRTYSFKEVEFIIEKNT